jgi:hypothetical protein
MLSAGLLKKKRRAKDENEDDNSKRSKISDNELGQNEKDHDKTGSINQVKSKYNNI